jgi:site-specific DNA recombinase
MPSTAPRTRTLRAVLYLRISEDKTGQALGVERQGEECRELCDRRGWRVVDTITENDVSATKGRRPGFAQLLEMITSRALNVVVIWAVDRLVRQVVELEQLIDACERNGVRIATVTGDLDLGTDTGRLVARVLTSVARAEIERKSARQAAAFRQAAKAGKPSGGIRAFGYTADGLHLDPAEAPVLVDLYQRFTTGATLGELCRMLNGKGIRTPRGNQWQTHSLRQVLLNPRNAGLRGVRWLAHDADGRPVLNEQGQQRRIQFHDIVGAAQWPGAVDEPVWRAACTILKDPIRRKHYKGRTRKHLLSGIAVCAVDGCGRTLKMKTNNNARNLFCPALNHVCRKAEPVEQFVQDVILERLRQDDAIDLVQTRTRGIDLSALKDEGDAIRERLREFARAEVLGHRTRDEVEAAREIATERLSEIDQAVADAGRVDVVARFVGAGRDPLEVWEDERTTLAIKQGLITSLAVVRIGSGRVGRPSKYTRDLPPPNVLVDWLR